MRIESKFRTYGLQVVVFLSFLALFSFIIAGIVFYGYQSNLDIMLQSSDELLYQISETITRQINSHLEPANKNGVMVKRLIENNVISTSTVEFNESFFIESLETFPQFQSIYFGDEKGDYFMTYRDNDDNFVTKVISRTSPPYGLRLITKDLDHKKISDVRNKDLSYDPRERLWYKKSKRDRESGWTSEYFLYTAREPGVTCTQPLFDSEMNFIGAVGIDFRLNEINSFLKSLKIGESGIAFICDNQGNIFAHPAKVINKKGSSRFSSSANHPRSPAEQALKTSAE
ncbi:MAG: cache domain-containing protein, partial [Candidatus Riflebacteria bacterium]|nr:cache domain-containing protein [Candidatus Riflebacteria bacterium]